MTATTPRGADTVPELLRKRLNADPATPAVVDPAGRSLTVERWYQRSQEVAAALVQRGVQPGHRVWLVADNAEFIDFAVDYLGVVTAGAVAVAVGSGDYRRLVGAAGFDAVLTVTHGAVPPVRVPWPTVPGSRLRSPGTPPVALPAIRADMAADISFTSGTGGRPKPVLSRHETLCAAYTSASLRAPVSAASRYLVALPFGTTYAKTVFLDALQIPGGALHLAAAFDPAAFAEQVARAGAGVTFLVPSMLEALLRQPELRWDRMRSLEFVCVSGSAVRSEALAELARGLPDATVVNSYCSTESWPAGTDWTYAPDEALSAGHPWEGREVEVVDPQGRPCPTGTVGTVRMRSLGVLPRQLLHDAAEPAPRDSWTTTDDLGRLEADGRLTLVGRQDDVFTSGGTQISPAELEGALTSHPAVAGAAVLPVPHPSLGAVPIALVETVRPVTERELLRLALDRLGAERAPRGIYVVPSLPTTAAGKVDRTRAAALLTRIRAGAGPEPGAAGTAGTAGTVSRD